MALAHAQLDHMLRLLIKTLAGITVEEARAATIGMGSARLRDLASKLAKQAFGVGAVQLRVQALIGQCEILTESRNQLLHGICARELDRDNPDVETQAIMLDEHLGTRRMPKVTELRELSDKLSALVSEINGARLLGFIAQAMLKKSSR